MLPAAKSLMTAALLALVCACADTPTFTVSIPAGENLGYLADGANYRFERAEFGQLWVGPIERIAERPARALCTHAIVEPKPGPKIGVGFAPESLWNLAGSIVGVGAMTDRAHLSLAVSAGLTGLRVERATHPEQVPGSYVIGVLPLGPAARVSGAFADGLVDAAAGADAPHYVQLAYDARWVVCQVTPTALSGVVHGELPHLQRLPEGFAESLELVEQQVDDAAPAAPASTPISTVELDLVGLDVTSAGDLVVSDRRGSLRVLDDTGATRQSIGATGDAEGEFPHGPASIAVGSAGEFYVVADGLDCVLIFDASGAYQGMIAVGRSIGDIAVSPDGVLVLTTPVYNEVLWLDARTGELLHSAGGTGQGRGVFTAMGAVAVGPSGDVYVADRWRRRVQRFGPRGMWKGMIDLPDTDARGPIAGLDVDEDGAIWIADVATSRLLALAPNGDLRTTVGRNADIMWGGSTIAIDRRRSRIWVADTVGARVHLFDLPPVDVKPAVKPTVSGLTIGVLGQADSALPWTRVARDLAPASDADPRAMRDPQTMAAALVEGTLDIAVLPANLAADLIEEGLATALALVDRGGGPLDSVVSVTRIEAKRAGPTGIAIGVPVETDTRASVATLLARVQTGELATAIVWERDAKRADPDNTLFQRTALSEPLPVQVVVARSDVAGRAREQLTTLSPASLRTASVEQLVFDPPVDIPRWKSVANGGTQ